MIVVFFIKQGHSKLDEEIKKIQRNWPYLLVVTNDSYQIFVVAEREILAEATSCWEALKATFGAYFAFNIDYPKVSKPFFVFFQFYVLNIKDSQPLPQLAARLKCTIDKI